MPIDSPLVSVCVPLYNKAAHVERTLRSIMPFRDHPLEIFVFDNGSTDGSSDIVARLSAEDSRIRCVRLDHTISIQESWRMALLHSKGDILKIQSADDELDPHFFTHMLPPLLASSEVDFTLCAERVEFRANVNINRELLAGCFLKINETCQKIIALPNLKDRARALVISSGVQSLMGNLFKILFRRKCLPLERWKQVVQAYSMPMTYPDWDFLMRILLNHRGVYIDKTLFTFLLHADSPISRVFSEPLQALGDAHQLLLQVVTVLGDPHLRDMRHTLTREELQYILNEGGKRLANIASIAHNIDVQQKSLNVTT